MLDGESIDWEKEDVAEAEVREGMKRLERIIARSPGRTLERAKRSVSAFSSRRGRSRKRGSRTADGYDPDPSVTR